MKCTVVIASANRASTLHETAVSLYSQTRCPDEILISLANPDHCSPDTRLLPNINVLIGPKGLTCQRNTALKNLSSGCDIVIFLDDDMVLRSDYLQSCLEFMEAHPDVAAMSGKIVADGSRTLEAISRNSAQAIIEKQTSTDHSVREMNLYGCNMVVRAEAARQILFDERLKLYGLFEDIDFGNRCRAKGKVVFYGGCVAVHLAERSGRISHKRLGFAQVMNLYYLWTKRSLSGLEMTLLLTHFVGGNLRGIIFPGRGGDRRARLVQMSGNLSGLMGILSSGPVPEKIETID